MSGERFVRTQAIQDAVRGHETEVLTALGINPRGRAHITCPFPDHDDANPSWRWDERKARAHCTCANGHALSIFDVLGQLEAIDFEAAKIRAAELIGRTDLIEEKDASTGQKMTAASLLAPPASKAAPALPRAYLAHRLSIALELVPTPNTPAAGWSTLPYWDPPVKKSGKPRLVAEPPCVVFETLSPDGRRHAHRIYTQPNGAGKAELGRRRDGRRRDPKKSAALEEGQSASGCVVLWGDPTRARHLILCEGIETAAALALARQAEIEAGEVVIAAGLSTSGIRSFQPWPTTRRVTIAADRDEDRPADGRGFKAGEQAARAFALTHHDRLETHIALPGQEGEDIDWLDILRRDGVETVRAGIDGAEAFSPTQKEIEAARRHAESTAELAEIQRSYPLPAMESLILDYRHTRSGRIMVHKYAGKDEEWEEIWLPVTSPVGVPSGFATLTRPKPTGCGLSCRGWMASRGQSTSSAARLPVWELPSSGRSCSRPD